jgi:hypothetical protein
MAEHFYERTIGIHRKIATLKRGSRHSWAF